MANVTDEATLLADTTATPATEGDEYPWNSTPDNQTLHGTGEG